MAIADYSATAANNATVLGVNIGEGCSPANLNDATRQLCADIAGGFNFSTLGTFFSSTSLASARSALGVAAGSTSLNNFAALTNTANKVPYMTGSDSWSLTDLFPVGGVIMMATSTAPTGWLECNGAAVSRTTYSSLFAIVGTTFGVGDGSTTFNLPDLRGEFVRGWDNSRGVDSGRAFGSTQSASVDASSLQLNLFSTTTIAHDASAEGDRTVQAAGTATSGFISGGSETRPRNVALMYVIKH